LVKKENWKDPAGLAATVAAAAPQKRRRVKPDIFCITNSLATDERIRVCLRRLTTQAGSEQAAEVYLYCAWVYQCARWYRLERLRVYAPISGVLIINLRLN